MHHLEVQASQSGLALRCTPGHSGFFFGQSRCSDVFFSLEKLNTMAPGKWWYGRIFFVQLLGCTSCWSSPLPAVHFTFTRFFRWNNFTTSYDIFFGESNVGNSYCKILGVNKKPEKVGGWLVGWLEVDTYKNPWSPTTSHLLGQVFVHKNNVPTPWNLGQVELCSVRFLDLKILSYWVKSLVAPQIFRRKFWKEFFQRMKLFGTSRLKKM